MTRLGLMVGAIFVLLGAVIVAFAQSTGARAKCSALDVAAIAMIEEHGRVADVPTDRLYGAASDHRMAGDMGTTTQELEDWARKPFWRS